MLTLCQMKIKEILLNNSLQNIDKLYLPTNLKQNLQTYYRSTIKGFLPDPKTLRSFVCNPSKSHLRLQCTMKRIDNENDSSSTTTTNLSGTTYVLYLEYLGGLIPLLTAKRVSKICPDFIIFDPQVKSTNSISSLSSLKSCSTTFQQIPIVQQQQTKIISNNNNNSTRSSLIANRNSIYVAESDFNANDDDTLANQSSSGCSSETETNTMTNNNNNNNDDDEIDECEQKTNDFNEKRSRKKTTKTIKHKHVREVVFFLHRNY